MKRTTELNKKKNDGLQADTQDGAVRLSSSGDGRKGSIELVTSGSSAFEARMARNSEGQSDLSSSDSIAHIMSLVESTAEAFRWTRPWKRHLLDEPGVWLCHRCEGTLHGAQGKHPQELSRLKSPAEREPGFPIRQRACRNCTLPRFCKMFSQYDA